MKEQDRKLRIEKFHEILWLLEGEPGDPYDTFEDWQRERPDELYTCLRDALEIAIAALHV